MTAEQYRFALAALGLTQGQAAEFLGISIRSSNAYANGETIPAAVSKLLTLMLRFKLRPEDL